MSSEKVKFGKSHVNNIFCERNGPMKYLDRIEYHRLFYFESEPNFAPESKNILKKGFTLGASIYYRGARANLTV